MKSVRCHQSVTREGSLSNACVMRLVCCPRAMQAGEDVEGILGVYQAGRSTSKRRISEETLRYDQQHKRPESIQPASSRAIRICCKRTWSISSRAEVRAGSTTSLFWSTRCSPGVTRILTSVFSLTIFGKARINYHARHKSMHTSGNGLLFILWNTSTPYRRWLLRECAEG